MLIHGPNALANSLLLVPQSLTDEEVDSQLKIAEKECLEARATYSLKQSVVEDVLVVDPILKAVHAGLNATPTERYSTSLGASMLICRNLWTLELYIL